MIPWQILENKLKNYFSKSSTEGKNRTPEIAAKSIEDIYIETLLYNAEDSYGNRVSSLNKYTLYNSLSSGFRNGLLIKKGPPSSLNGSGLMGLLNMWAGAQFTMEIPPPGSVRILSNSITNPGKSPVMSIEFNNSMIDELIRGFKLHATTISGITTSLVYTGTSLIPVQFPWTGVK